VRRLISIFALGVALVSIAWALYVVLFGGFDGALFGRPFRSREPLRPLLWASAALAVFAWANGIERTTRAWVARLSTLDHPFTAVAIAFGVGVIGVAYADTAAVGSDAYGYVSQVDRWMTGDLVLPQPWASEVPWPLAEWTFSPLGYRPYSGRAGAPAAIVPTYSAGLPLLMALFDLVAGYCARFWVVPVAGGLLVWTTYGIGRRLGAPRAGLVAAWLVATSPVFLFMLMPPMSDVPAAALWTLAVYFVLTPTLRAALYGGAATALAILVRPNLWPLAGILAAWCFFEARPGKDVPHRYSFRRLSYFMGCAAIGPLVTAGVYARLYGSPFVSGYGELDGLFAWAHVVPNIRNYVGWLVSSQTPVPFLGLAALFVPVRRLWPGVGDRRVLGGVALMICVVWAQYCGYLVFPDWMFLRFLLPSWPFMMLGVGAIATAAARGRAPAIAVAVAWVVLLLGVYDAQVAAARGAFDEWRTNRRFIDVAGRVRQSTEEASVIMTVLQSGSIRYYAGRQTLRFDYLGSDWLDRSVEWLTARGVHVYALLDQSEIADFRRRFSRQRTVERLDESLLFAYRGSTTMYFYDLGRPVAGTGRVETDGDLSRLRCALPLPAPSLVFTR